MKVVMYHYVQPLSKVYLKGLKGLDLKKFCQQLDYFTDNYTIISHEQFHDALKNGISLPEDSILLTFDDGYTDVYKYVFPELYKRGIKGLFYVPDVYSSKELLDVNAIHVILATERATEILGDIELHVRRNSGVKVWNTYLSKVQYLSRFDSDEVHVIKQMLQYILPVDVRKELLTLLINKFSSFDKETLFNEFYCTKDQLNIMIDNGMHIGGHGVTHSWLNMMEPIDQEREVLGTRDFLNSLHKQPFYSFCYPYGVYNEKTIALLKDYQFKFAFTTNVAEFSPENFSEFEIPRFDTNDFYPIINENY